MPPIVGEIRMFAGDFAPSGWAICDGEEYSTEKFEELFQLIGTTYGGDGLATFCVPDLRSRVPMCFGQGKNLTPRNLAETGGVETVTLSANDLPNHTHAARASSKAGNSDSPAGHFWASSPKINQFTSAAKINSSFNQKAIDFGGQAAPHENMPPFLAINFIISLFGVYPSKT